MHIQYVQCFFFISNISNMFLHIEYIYIYTYTHTFSLSSYLYMYIYIWIQYVYIYIFVYFRYIYIYIYSTHTYTYIHMYIDCNLYNHLFKLSLHLRWCFNESSHVRRAIACWSRHRGGFSMGFRRGFTGKWLKNICYMYISNGGYKPPDICS